MAQSGFRQLHSTVTELLQVTDCWLINIDKGLVTGVVFIDLCKAFDTVDLDILLAKLPSFGVEGVEHEQFRSYLTGRIQSVTVDGHLSAPLPVSIGVPQGSILDPLLFLLFLNDLLTIPQLYETTMYADDTECESASKTENYKELETTINNYFYSVKEYFDTNKLSLNVPKCAFMLVGAYHSLAKVPDIRIHINNEPLKQVTVLKYMGMKIDIKSKMG